MGYTHYWSGTPIFTPHASVDIRKIIRASGVKIAGSLGTGLPLVDLKGVIFNGQVPDDYETFALGSSDGAAIDFDFCKTAHKPYDIVVCAILLRVIEDSPNFSVSSDGDWENDWAPARALYATALGRETTVRALS